MKVSLVMLTLLEMKKPEQIHAMETAVTEFDQLPFPFKHPTNKMTISGCPWPHCAQFTSLVSHQPFKELEIQYSFSYIVKGFTWKCHISKISLASVYNSAFKVTTGPRSKIRWLSNTCCAFLWAVVLALCILVFSSCIFLFSFRTHPSDEYVELVHACTMTTRSVLLFSLYFCVVYLKHSDLFC